jgi:hypothetical protein
MTETVKGLAVPDIDALLARRGLRDHTLGPTGGRLFCPYLANGFGWPGRLCWLHERADQPVLADPFTIRIWVGEAELSGQRSACMWYPGYALRQVKEAGLGVVERKFITDDDVACEVIELSNHSDKPLTVKLAVIPCEGQAWVRTSRDCLSARLQWYGQPVRLLLAAPVSRPAPADQLVCELTVAPGQSTSLIVALAVGIGQPEATAALQKWVSCADPWAEHQRQQQAWYEAWCPRFDCPDQRLVRLWWYRWFMARHNYVRPELETAHQGGFYAGKQGASACMTTASGPYVLKEVRWLKSPTFGHEVIEAYLSSQSASGLYRDRWADTPPTTQSGEGEGRLQGADEWLSAALWEVLLVHPAPRLMAPVAQSMADQVAALRRLRDSNHNSLLTAAGPVTGQMPPPSYGYFADFRATSEVPVLERVECSAMYYASLRATAQIMAALERQVDAQWHDGLAEKCRQAVLEKMWDSWDGYFYALREADGEPARVMEAWGLTPFTFGLVPSDPEYHRALAHLTDVNEGLWTTYPVASVAQNCPAYSPHPAAAKAGEQVLATGPGSGAVWPGQVSLVIEALAEVLRYHEQSIITRARLMELFWLYARLMNEDNEPAKPMVQQVHDAESGAGWGCPDHWQSSFNDLIIRHLAGVQPEPGDQLTIDPLVTGWRYLRLEGIPYRGLMIDIIWENRAAGEGYTDVEAGLTVRVDGVTVAHRSDLGPLQIEVPPLLSAVGGSDQGADQSGPEGDRQGPELTV